MPTAAKSFMKRPTVFCVNGPDRYLLWPGALSTDAQTAAAGPAAVASAAATSTTGLQPCLPTRMVAVASIFATLCAKLNAAARRMVNTAPSAAAIATKNRLLPMGRPSGTQGGGNGHVGQAYRVERHLGRLSRRARLERDHLAGDIDLVARGVGDDLGADSMSKAVDRARPEDPPRRPAARAQQRVAVLRRIEIGRRGSGLWVIGRDRDA